MSMEDDRYRGELFCWLVCESQNWMGLREAVAKSERDSGSSLCTG